ncbi:MAG: hypothetical protein AAF387_05165 [Pseudomonadota bacterium]
MLSHKALRVALLRGPLFAGVFFLVCIAPFDSVLGAVAESSATIGWGSAFGSGSPALQSYKVGADLSEPTQTLIFDNLDPDAPAPPPSNSNPHNLSLINTTVNASTFADSSDLVVQSMSSEGDIGAEAQMVALFFLSGSGTLNISIPYALSALTMNSASESTVGIFAALETFDATGLTTGVVDATPASVTGNGLGEPNDLTGMLALQIAYDSADVFAVLDFTVFSESSAVQLETTTVPIPGGFAWLAPVLLPLCASKKRGDDNNGSRALIRLNPFNFRNQA